MFCALFLNLFLLACVTETDILIRVCDFCVGEIYINHFIVFLKDKLILGSSPYMKYI